MSPERGECDYPVPCIRSPASRLPGARQRAACPLRRRDHQRNQGVSQGMPRSSGGAAAGRLRWCGRRVLGHGRRCVFHVHSDQRGKLPTWPRLRSPGYRSAKSMQNLRCWPVRKRVLTDTGRNRILRQSEYHAGTASPPRSVVDPGGRLVVWSDCWAEWDRQRYVGPTIDASDRRHRMSLAPIWRGFVVNTTFYGAAVWLTGVGVVAARRRFRLRRGLCPLCAYNLSGIASMCPECGGS